VNPCRDSEGNLYTTPRLVDRCMETERIVIESQDRLLAFCQVRDETGVASDNPCPMGVCRLEILQDVFPDPEVAGSVQIIEEANYYVFKKKQTIRECRFAPEARHMRNEDFVALIQDKLYNEMTPGMCSLIAAKLCEQLGGDPENMTPIDNSQCCDLSELPNSWTIESPELFEAWCGSGFKFGNEQCDDGNLAYYCDETRFECPAVSPGQEGRVLRKNDGCDKFCRTETEFGWVCTPGPQKGGGSGAPVPDECACNCDCNYKCTCQDIIQRNLCRVDPFGVQTDAENPDLQIQCCDAL